MTSNETIKLVEDIDEFIIDLDIHIDETDYSNNIYQYYEDLTAFNNLQDCSKYLHKVISKY